jgi:CPA2 family monovalent cation:H+ antiporter-2
MRAAVLGLGAKELVGGAVLIALGLMMLGNSLATAAALGLALALSSTALVLRIADQNTPVGRAALAMLLFEDIALVPILFLLSALGRNGENAGITGMITTIGLGALVVAVLLVAGRLILPRLFEQAARTKSPELFFAVSLLVVILASLATGAVGLSPIVGALIAGLLIAETEYDGEVGHMIAPFKGLALGVFLLTVGMGLDLTVLWERMGEILIAVALVFSAKALVTGVLLRMSGARLGTSAETGILLASPSETTLIVLGAAQAGKLILPSAAQFWEIVTALGLTVTPILAIGGHWLAKRLDHAAQAPSDEGLAPKHAIVVGCGRVGRLVAEMLREHGQPYVAIDIDPELVKAARADGIIARYADAARSDALERLGLDEATAVIFTMDEPVAVQRHIRRLRAARPDLPIIARARDASHAAALYRAGASHAVPETLESSLQLSEAVLVDLGVAMGPVIASIHEKRDELRAQIMEEGNLAAKPQLKSAGLRERIT